MRQLYHTVSYFLTDQLAKLTRPQLSVIKEIKWLQSCINYKHIKALIKSQASSLSGWGNSTQTAFSSKSNSICLVRYKIAYLNT